MDKRRGIFVGLTVCQADAAVLSECMEHEGLKPVDHMHMTLVQRKSGNFDFDALPRPAFPITLKARMVFPIRKYSFRAMILGTDGSGAVRDWLRGDMTDYIRSQGMDIGKHNLDNHWRNPHVSLSYEMTKGLEFQSPIETITFDDVVVSHNKANAWMDG